MEECSAVIQFTLHTQGHSKNNEHIYCSRFVQSVIESHQSLIQQTSVQEDITTGKVIESSNHNQNSEVLSFGRYKNIFLTRADYENLKKDFPGRIDSLIESMSSYLETTGKKYRNCDAALRSWASRNTGKPEKMNFYNNEIPYEEGTSL